MIKKLRIKLVAASMLSLFLVLAVIMGVVNFLNYRQIRTAADSTLAILQENGGVFPRPELFFDPGRHDGRQPSPELPYESRYFSALLSAEGDVVSVDTGRIAAVDADRAAEMARRVWQDGAQRGFVRDYRFVRYEEEGQTRIIFLDCGRDLSTFRTFLILSCGISALGLLAVFGLILLLSRRIIRPVSESYEKQKRFITDAGHEMKTPVTIIDADVEVLEMELGENEWLRDIQAQTRRLADLTNDLVLLSRMEEDRPLPARIALPFSDLVYETAQSFQGPATAQGKTLTLRIQPMLSVCGDEKTLRQLVSILLDNALKYSSEKGFITVELAPQRPAKSLCLTVENTVDAMAPEDLQRLFDRFYRADKSRNSQVGGYGLGLSIAKAIVEAHQGKIQATLPAPNLLRMKVSFPLTDAGGQN